MGLRSSVSAVRGEIHPAWQRRKGGASPLPDCRQTRSSYTLQKPLSLFPGAPIWARTELPALGQDHAFSTRMAPVSAGTYLGVAATPSAYNNRAHRRPYPKHKTSINGSSTQS